MPGRGDAHHLVGVHVHPLQLVEGRFVLHEADVDFAVHDLARNFVEAAAIDADLDVGKLLQVALERRRQQVDGGGLVRGDGQRAGLERLELGDLPQRFVAQVHHAASVVGEHAPGLGERDLVHVAGEERRADLLFELLDALTDRRLRPAHALGRARERALFDDGQEMFELQEIHGARSSDDARIRPDYSSTHRRVDRRCRAGIGGTFWTTPFSCTSFSMSASSDGRKSVKFSTPVSVTTTVSS